MTTHGENATAVVNTYESGGWGEGQRHLRLRLGVPPEVER
jgi:hypothetical protein